VTRLVEHENRVVEDGIDEVVEPVRFLPDSFLGRSTGSQIASDFSEA
jgi:hypothetical protein